MEGQNPGSVVENGKSQNRCGSGTLLWMAKLKTGRRSELRASGESRGRKGSHDATDRAGNGLGWSGENTRGGCGGDAGHPAQCGREPGRSSAWRPQYGDGFGALLRSARGAG